MADTGGAAGRPRLASLLGGVAALSLGVAGAALLPNALGPWSVGLVAVVALFSGLQGLGSP